MTRKNFASAILLLALLLSTGSLSGQSSAEYLHGSPNDLGLFEAYWHPARLYLMRAGSVASRGPDPVLSDRNIRLSSSWSLLSVPDGWQSIQNEAEEVFRTDAPQLPTALGGDSDAIVQYIGLNPVTGEEVSVRTFEAPDGFGMRSGNLYRMDAAVGLGLGVELGGSMMIPQKAGNWRMGGFGIGMAVDGEKLVRSLAFVPIDLMLTISYQQMRIAGALPYEALPGTEDMIPPNPLPQTMTMINHQALARIVVSHAWGPVRPFVSAGLSRNENIIQVEGDYPFTNVLVDQQTGAVSYTARSTRNPYYGLFSTFLPHVEAGVSCQWSVVRLMAVVQVGPVSSASLQLGIVLGKE